MKKAELVFLPLPGISHFVSMTEFAKCLLDRDELRLSITILVMCRPGTEPEIVAKLESIPASDPRIRCITIPSVELIVSSNSMAKCLSEFIEANKSQIEETIRTKILLDDSVQLAGIVLDMFGTSIIDVAHKLNVPCYIYFPCSAAFLGLLLYLPVHGVDHFDPLDVHDQSSTVPVPSYANSVPMKVLPDFAFDKDGYTPCFYHGTRYKETKGIIINTFAELEPHAIGSLMSPPIYPVGPLIDLSSTVKENSKKWNDDHEIVAWLDDQPPSSVVFLCFGTGGYFDGLQLEQIAIALESCSQQRFLWSIRRPPPKGSFEIPAEYQNVQELPLPVGFLERTEKRGKVCGWVPQVQLLAHQAIGGFVSHCGWNSTLESLWHGVPIATWPFAAEQQINAFELVEELGLAVDLKMDYRQYGSGDDQVQVVMGDVIERAIKSLMDVNNTVRRRAKMMGEKSSMAVADGGSSSASLGRLIEDFLENIQVI